MTESHRNYRIERRWQFALIGIALLILGLVALPFIDRARIEYRWRQYYAIHPGATTADIERLFGSPDHIRRGRDMWNIRSWDFEKLPDIAAPTSFEYEYRISNVMLGLSFLIGFDEDGKAVTKHSLD